MCLTVEAALRGYVAAISITLRLPAELIDWNCSKTFLTY